MVTIPSAYTWNEVWSFSVRVSNDTTIEQLLQQQARILSRNTYAICSEYTQISSLEQKFIIQFPLEYVNEKFRSEEQLLWWQGEMEKMKGNAKFLGIFPWFISRHENQVKEYNRMILTSGLTKQDSNDLLIKENKWVTFEVPIERYSTKTYHSFVLVRYLWVKHYMRIIDTYKDIQECLTITKPEPCMILQMAHYSHEPIEGTKRYCDHYCHLRLGTFAKKLKKMDDIHMTSASGLNNSWSGETIQSVSYEAIHELLNQRKYKKAYDLLKG